MCRTITVRLVNCFFIESKTRKREVWEQSLPQTNNIRNGILILFKDMHKAIAYPDYLIRGVARVPGARRKNIFAPPPTKTVEFEVKNRHESKEKNI